MTRPDVWVAVAAMALPLAVQRGAIRNVTVSPSPVEAGGAVEITVTGDNPCGAVRLDYGDGTQRVTHPLTEVPATIRYVYKEPGTYQIRAEGMGNCDGEASTRIGVRPSPGAPEPQGARFLEMDANGDGVVTRSEWRGSARAFRSHDWNDDGVLSGEELRPRERAAGASGAEMNVDSTVRWTNTGVYVREGETVRVDSRGSVQLSGDPADRGGPAGVKSQRRAPSAPLPAHPAGALIARVDDSAPVFVGSARQFRAPATGQLYLGVNDDYLGDNTGEFRVRIDVERRNR